MGTNAILTCDIVNSTKLTAAKEKNLIASIKKIFAAYKIEFFRGDSFQVYIKETENALFLSLLTRLAAIKLNKEQKLEIIDVRISIGIGEVKLPIKLLATAKGQAFLLSGRAFDEIAKTNQRLAIAISNPLANEGLNVLTDYVNQIFEKISGKQAEVLFELLHGATQHDVSKKIKKTKSTVHQLTTAGQWPQIEKLLQQYQNIIKLVQG
jgi:ABC-type iron transport system FetAB permease component